MKKNKLIKFNKLLTLIPLSLFIPLISASCRNNSNNNNENNHNKEAFNDQKPVSGAIKYLAIGDDYTIGNNYSNNIKNNNFYNKKTNEVLGISYPSYLTNYIMMMNDNKTFLDSYTNLGLSSSNTDSWLYLLSPNTYKNKKDNFENIKRVNKDLGLVNSNIEPTQIINAIRSSNLLTISLGFNDVFLKHELLDLILNNYQNTAEKIKLFKQKVQKRIKIFKENYLTIIDEIREINKNININLTGFLSPLLQTLNINDKNGLNNVLSELTALLNKTIKEVAQIKKINYYSFENEDYIKNNINNFSTDFLNIFPNKNAYKKLSQDVFAKMSILSPEYNKLFELKNKSNHNFAIQFSKKPTTIKSSIFGINDLKTDSFLKEYAFEKNKFNEEIINSEKINNFIDYLLFELLAKLDNISNEELPNFISSILSLIGIKKEEVYKTFLDSVNIAIKQQKTTLVKNLFKEILKSDSLKTILTRSNTKLLELVAKKSHSNISFDEIKNLTNSELLQSSNFYSLIKEIFNEKFLNKKENIEFIKNLLPSLIKAGFEEKIINKIFPSKLKNIFLSSKNLNNKIDLIIKEISNNLLDKTKRQIYFKNEDYKGFIKSLFSDIKDEIIVLIFDLITEIKKEKTIFNKAVKQITSSIKETYQINNEDNLNNIEYFIWSLLSELKIDLSKKDEISYQLLDFFVKNVLINLENSETPIIKSFFEALALKNKEGANKNNALFLKLIGYTPITQDIDKEKFNKGLVSLATSLFKIDSFLNFENLKKLVDNKDSLLSFLNNLNNNENKKLITETVKKNIELFISTVLDETLNNQIIKNLLNGLGNYFITSPLINFIKDNGYEKQILNLNKKFKSIEELVNSWFLNIYNLFDNKDVKEKIKDLITNIIFDPDNKYNKEDATKFIVSILENADKNGLFAIIETIFKNLDKNKDSFGFLIDILIITLDSKLKIKIDETEKNKLKTYLNNFLSKFPKSDLFKNLKETLISSIKRIGNKEIKDLNQLLTALKDEILASTKDLLSYNNIKDFFNLILNNEDNKQKQEDFILKSIKFFLEKINDTNRDFIKAKITSLLEVPLIRDFLKNKLNNLEELILKEDSNAAKFANLTKTKLNKLLFEDKSIKEFLNLAIDSILKLGSDQIKEVNNLGELLKKIFEANKETLNKILTKLIEEVTEDENYLKGLLNFLINLLGTKLKFDSESSEVENIVNLLTRIIKESEKQNLISDTAKKVLEELIKNGILSDKIDFNDISKKLLETLKNIDYASIFTEDFFEKLAQTVFNKSITKEQLSNELKVLYSYLTRNASKIKLNLNVNKSTPAYATKHETAAVRTEPQSVPGNKTIFDTLEKLIINSIKGLNSSISGEDYKKAREAITETVYFVIQDQIKNAIKNVKTNLISTEELNKFIENLINNQHFKKIISLVIEEILTKNEYNETKVGNLLNKILTKISTKINEKFAELLKSLISDEKITNLVADSLIKLLKLVNTDDNDKKFLSDLIKNIGESLFTNEYFKKKIVQRTTQHITDKSKDFTIEQPFKWIIEAFEKIKSGFSAADIGILSELVGENKPLNGANLVKLINLLFGKSDFENSFLYKALRNINNDPDPSKRTNMDTLRSQVKISKLFDYSNSNQTNDDPYNIKPNVDYLALLNTIFKLVAGEFDKNINAKDKKSFIKRSQTPEWKAVYRLEVLLFYIIFEMFGRETLLSKREGNWRESLSLYTGVRAILWELQEGTNIKWIPGVGNKFSGMQSYFKDEALRRQFTNYAVSETGWIKKTWKYFDEDTYGPESIVYILTSSGYNEKEDKKENTEFKYIIDEKNKDKRISKKEYILLTLKEGGYGKFMKINGKKSESTWSKLNEVQLNDFYPDSKSK